MKLVLRSGKPPEKKKETIKIEGKQAQHYFCSGAARTGNLALVRWLREVKKFDWNDWTINRAAANWSSSHCDVLHGTEMPTWRVRRVHVLPNPAISIPSNTCTKTARLGIFILALSLAKTTTSSV